MESFTSLAAAIKQRHQFGLYVPGGQASVSDPDEAGDYVDRVLSTIETLPTYELGTLDMEAVDTTALIAAGKYCAPHPLCAIHFRIEESDVTMDQIFILQQDRELVAVTSFAHLGDDQGWLLAPYTMAIDPDDYESPTIADLDGFSFDIEDKAAFDAAMSIEVEFLDRVLLALSLRPN
jgi:hypothetical protein